MSNLYGMPQDLANYDGLRERYQACTGLCTTAPEKESKLSGKESAAGGREEMTDTVGGREVHWAPICCAG